MPSEVFKPDCSTARSGLRLTALAARYFDTETLSTKYPLPVVEAVAGRLTDEGGKALAERRRRKP